MKSEPITEVETIDADGFFDRFVTRSRPLVVRGAVRHWPAAALWDDAYMRAAAGDALVETAHLFDGHVARFMPGHGDYREMTLAHFIDEHAADDRAYLTDSDVPEALLGDLGDSPLLRAFDRLADVERRTAMYLAHGRRLTPLHYDDEENLYCMVQGRKRFRLIAPDWFHHVEPHDDGLRMDHASIDLDASSDDVRSSTAEIACAVVDLHAGDALYIPCGWWHQVDSFDRSLAVSFVRFDEARFFALFVRLVDRGIIPAEPATRIELARLCAEPTTAIEPGEALGDSLLLSLVRYRMARVYGHGEPPDALTPVRAQLAARLGSADFDQPTRYFLQNVFRLPNGDFER